MVEGQGRGPGGGPTQRLEVGVGADHHVGTDLGRGVTGCGGQHPQGLAEGDCGLVGHPGQLAAADHRHDWGCAHDAYGVTPASPL